MVQFARIVRTCTESGPSNPLTLPHRASAAIIAALAFAGIVAQAQASSDFNNGPTPNQLAQARQICESIMRVRPGEEHFDGCVSSLTDSLEVASHSRIMQQAHNDCFAKGLKPNTSDLAVCILQAADTNTNTDSTNPPNIANMNASQAEDAELSGSAFAASPDVIFRREQLACAQIGFDPAFGAFANCVANLSVTLESVDHPED